MVSGGVLLPGAPKPRSVKLLKQLYYRMQRCRLHLLFDPITVVIIPSKKRVFTPAIDPFRSHKIAKNNCNWFWWKRGHLRAPSGQVISLAVYHYSP